MIARWWLLGVLAAVGLSRAGAHQELYHNIDVDLRETVETGVIKMAFTIHAPEFLVGFSEAADAMFDSRWLGRQSDEELERIVELSRAFLAERFGVRVDAGKPVDLREEVVFEDFERIRSGGDLGLPPACILAVLELPLTEGARELQVEHAASSQKRLMLVVYRPKSFPAVTDVETGSSAVVLLREEAKVPEVAEVRDKKDGVIFATMVLTGLVGFGVFLMRRGVRRSRRSEGLRTDQDLAPRSP